MRWKNLSIQFNHQEQALKITSKKSFFVKEYAGVSLQNLGNRKWWTEKSIEAERSRSGIKAAKIISA